MKRHASALVLASIALASLAGCSASPERGNSEQASRSRPSPTTTTLRIPLVDEHAKPLARHNDALAKLGLEPFPAFVEGDFRTLRVAFDKESTHYENVREKIGAKDELLQYVEPGDFEFADAAASICYTGDPRGVVDVIGELTDDVFSDQLSIVGWKYKNEKHFTLADEDSDGDESGMPQRWLDWSGDSDAVLVVTASDDDGTAFNAGAIVKCSDTTR